MPSFQPSISLAAFITPTVLHYSTLTISGTWAVFVQIGVLVCKQIFFTFWRISVTLMDGLANCLVIQGHKIFLGKFCQLLPFPKITTEAFDNLNMLII